ncbi:MAG: ABC transporter permease subunit [Candidatus Fermentibacteraceae bacterium]|nr:ABC transporter permease subunit [Candidatus Fermentibacteraceae bacterium]
MRPVMTFALMTLRSLLRRRTIWGISIVILIALVGIGQVPGYGVSNQGRFMLDFGLFGLEIGTLLLAIGLASNIYPRDRERKTVMPIIAVPLSRGQYLMGRFVGAALVQAAAMLAGCLGLMVILILNEHAIPPDLFPATGLLIVEGWFLLAVVFFFSFWTSPPLNAPLTILLFIVSQMSVSGFVGLLPTAPGIMRTLRLLLPHMDVFHIKDPIAHGMDVPGLYFLLAMVYGLSYMVFMLAVALAVFRKRDLK